MPRKPKEDSTERLLSDSPLAPSAKRTRIRRAIEDEGTGGKGRRRAGGGVEDAQLELDEDEIKRLARRMHVKRELLGITLLLGALFIVGALIFGRMPEGGQGCGASGGAFGPVGGCIRWSILGIFGFVGAIVFPLVPAAHALHLLGRIDHNNDKRFLVLTIGLVLTLPVAVGLWRLGGIPEGTADVMSGLWGSFTAHYVAQALGNGGAWFLVAIAICGLLAVTIGWNPLRVLLGIGTKRGAKVEEASVTAAELMEPDPDEMPAMDPSLMGLAGVGATSPMAKAGPAAGSVSTAVGADKSVESAFGKGDIADPGEDDIGELGEDDIGELGEEDIDELGEDDIDEVLFGARSSASRRGRGVRVGDASGEGESGGIGARGLRRRGPVPDADALPDANLLTPAPERNVEAGKAQLDAMGEKLMLALRTFRVEGVLTGYTSGPTVTQFEIEPAPGVKVRQFANLADDLALAMRAPSIRVVAPIPGKGAVGIEVPNPVPEMVAFREMLESRDYQQKPMALPIALGKDLEGRAVIADLAKMPHLLIAGATGSGKSVCVNTIITSLIYRHTPKTLRFLMVDPKMVELSVYNSLPHLRHKVVTDNRDAAAVLKWAVYEMQERYALLAENGARNIQDFNAKVRDGVQLRKPKDPNVGFENRDYTGGVLPYIVVVIDELADLMMTVAAEVETPLAMLAQKARAIGIHLILATQRPSVNVITGLIKANFPSRIAFRVASQIDSRTIIDGMGAESLLGNGDMLFIPPGKSEPSRLQGAFLSNDDTERLMGWYVEKRDARRAALEGEGLIATDESSEEGDILAAVRAREAAEAGPAEEGEGDVGDRDKLFREAAEICIHNQGGSTSLLQRRLKIGYGRAARIIDQLHLSGVLGPPDGSKPREVLMGLEDLDRL